MTPSPLTQTVLDTCDALALHTEAAGEITRPYLCPSARAVHDYLSAWATRLGMTTTLDAVGNLRSRLASSVPGAPTLYIGSHLDTVPNAGRYDGILGVVMGYALAEAMQGQPQQSQPLPYNLEILGFSEEEGVRYGVSFIGSRALVGTADELLEVKDKAGDTVRGAILGYGLNPDHLPHARSEGGALGYLEFHIEQGPVLQDVGASVGVVSAIVGQDRLNLHFVGRASHAGTTPMHLRRDALAAAARFMVAAEELARATPGLVATVGMVEAKPGAGNVIPGEVTCSLDIRHEHDDVRAASLQKLLDIAQHEAQARQVVLSVIPKMSEAATPMSQPFRQLLHQAAADLSLKAPELVSGAGHDAQIMAQVMPAAMLFIRSPNALSHHPDEMVNPEDVDGALRVGQHFLELLAKDVSA